MVNGTVKNEDGTLSKMKRKKELKYRHECVRLHCKSVNRKTHIFTLHRRVLHVRCSVSKLSLYVDNSFRSTTHFKYQMSAAVRNFHGLAAQVLLFFSLSLSRWWLKWLPFFISFIVFSLALAIVHCFRLFLFYNHFISNPFRKIYSIYFNAWEWNVYLILFCFILIWVDLIFSMFCALHKMMNSTFFRGRNHNDWQIKSDSFFNWLFESGFLILI